MKKMTIPAWAKGPAPEGEQFALGEQRWATLDDAIRGCVRGFKRNLRSIYPAEKGYINVRCAYVADITAPKLPDECGRVGCTIWDLSGKRAKRIEGALTYSFETH